MAVKPIVKFIRNSRGGSGNVDPQLLFGNLAQTNHYQVDFSSLSTFGGQGLLGYIEDKFGVNLDFISRDSGLLCSEASLPGTSLATAEVKDNFMGISQEFAHTRLYTDFDFTFYVDNDYNNLRFFEGWIDFISSGSEILGPIGDGALPSQSNYYRRMRYPDSYKCQTISITKFEKNFGPRMTYSFMNAFPKLISAVPVSYGGADVLKVSVSFNYDRYVIGNNGFSKGVQDNSSFVDPKQQSAELQQIELNKTLNSIAIEKINQTRQIRLEEETQEIVESGRRPSGGYGGGSDIRIKENIIKINKSPSGLNIYEWNYKSAPNSRYQGVMAQEVIKVFPEAVYAEEDGFLSVYYDMIDVDMKLVI